MAVKNRSRSVGAKADQGDKGGARNRAVSAVAAVANAVSRVAPALPYKRKALEVLKLRALLQKKRANQKDF